MDNQNQQSEDLNQNRSQQDAQQNLNGTQDNQQSKQTSDYGTQQNEWSQKNEPREQLENGNYGNGQVMDNNHQTDQDQNDGSNNTVGSWSAGSNADQSEENGLGNQTQDSYGASNADQTEGGISGDEENEDEVGSALRNGQNPDYRSDQENGNDQTGSNNSSTF